MEHAQKRDHAEAYNPEPEAPADTTREALRGFLRSLTFAEGAAALAPGGGGTPEQPAPTLDPSMLQKLMAVVPGALAETGEQVDAPGVGTSAKPADKQDEKAEQEADEAAQAEALVSEAEPDVEPAVISDPVRQPGKDHKPKPKKPDRTPLKRKRARQALRWTKRQPFANVRFVVRRYQRVLGEPASGRVTLAFGQAVARFQKRQGIKPVNGKLGGRTARRMRHLLRKRYKLDKKGLLTKGEVRMAQVKNRKAMKKGRLSWKTVRQLRVLLGLKKKGGLDGTFLRRVAAFQVKHKLPRAGVLDKKTIRGLRNSAAPKDANAAIYAAAQSYEGYSSATGPDGGNLACAWMVNKVLKSAIGRTVGSNTNLVSSVESELGKIGFQVTHGKAKAGDIVVAPGLHIGIAMGGGRCLSNSSSRARFSWWSNLSFDGAYGVSTRIWRIKAK